MVEQFYEKIDLNWAVFEVIDNGRGKTEDMVIVRASDKYRETIQEEQPIGKKYCADIVGERDERFLQQCYDCAYHKKTFRDRLTAKRYENWINYILVNAGEKGLCYIAFFELDDNEMRAQRTKISWNTAEVVIECAKTLRGKDEFDIAIQKVLSKLASIIMPDRLYLLIVNGNVANVMYEWLKSKKLYSARELFNGYSIKKLMNWKKNMGDSDDGIFILQDIPSLDASTNYSVAIMQEHGLKNIIHIPMYHGGNLVGFFVIDNFEDKHLVDIRELIETVSFFIVSEFVNNKLMGDLRVLGNIDILTQVSNRNAMNAKVLELEGQEGTLGVVYADVNGLKQVNDTQGHEKGDELIKNAANCLTKVFRRREVYRAGGDEFVVLMPGIPKEIFDTRIAAMEKVLSETQDVSIALGHHWTTSAWDVQKALNEADAAMYENKKKYYEKLGITR